MFPSPELDSLNSAKYIFLRELSEPRDNSLRLIVDEAVANRARMVQIPELPELAAIAKDASLIELFWKHYCAHLVTEASVGSCAEHGDETYTGKLFRVYTKSHFLDHLARDTGAHTQPIQHYKLTCQNHLIDIASYAPPDIRVTVKTSSSRARPLVTP
jgi:hypothetical protein